MFIHPPCGAVGFLSQRCEDTFQSNHFPTTAATTRHASSHGRRATMLHLFVTHLDYRWEFSAVVIRPSFLQGMEDLRNNTFK